jgi:broad specificity phosphatase PhoE
MCASLEAITRVILIRHGQTADTIDQRLSGRRETPLTPLGETQAEQAAAQLARTYRVDALYTSPVGRARQTAAIIGHMVGCPPDPDPRLAEMHFGQIEGLTELEFKAQWPEMFSAAEDRRDPEFRWPGGESRLEFRARAQSVFEEIVARHPGQTVGIVSHGGIISVILQNVAADQSLFWRGYLVGTCHMVEVEVAGSGRRFRLLEGSCFLDTPQFETPAPGADSTAVRMATMSQPVDPPGGEPSAAPPSPTAPEASPAAADSGAYNPPPKVDWRDRPQRDMPKRPLDQWLSDFEQRVQESDARRALEAERAREREASERGRQQARRGDGREAAQSPSGSARSGPPDPSRRRRRRGRGGGGRGQPAAGSPPGAATGQSTPSGPAPSGPAPSGPAREAGQPPVPGRRPGRSRGRRRRPPHSPQGPGPGNKPSR